MSSINSLLNALSERTIAQRVGIPHDEARMQYALRSNTVSSWDEFCEAITDYYQYHYCRCVAHGGRLSRDEAAARAKDLIDRAEKRHQRDIVTAYRDAHDGLNMGLRGVLDQLADGMKAEAIDLYVKEEFDKHRIKTIDFSTGIETDRYYTKVKLIDMVGFIEGLRKSKKQI